MIALKTAEAHAEGPGRVHLVESLLAGSGPILDVAGRPEPGGPPAPLVMALGSTFAKIGAGGSDGLIALQDEVIGDDLPAVACVPSTNFKAGRPG